ncbi:MAG: alpha/beta fold hydrolase [Planctomycetota bacterium]
MFPSKASVAVFVIGWLSMLSLRAQPATDNRYTRDDWLRILQDKETVDYPIVFVHGIGGGFRNWDATANLVSNGSCFRIRFQRDGTLHHDFGDSSPTTHSVWNVSYYEARPIKEAFTGNLSTYANRLREIVTVIKRLTQRDKVILICHSMGGLVGRASMIIDTASWDSVHKIVTVGTPNEGVTTSIGIVGQLADLRRGSDFLKRLNANWIERLEQGDKRWGVVGGVDIGPNRIPTGPNAGSLTDSGGIGFIELSSAIPFSEWKACLGSQFGQASFDTTHFGYRIAVRGRHNGLVNSAAVDRAIEWALRP